MSNKNSRADDELPLLPIIPIMRLGHMRCERCESTRPKAGAVIRTVAYDIQGRVEFNGEVLAEGHHHMWFEHQSLCMRHVVQLLHEVMADPIWAYAHYVAADKPELVRPGPPGEEPAQASACTFDAVPKSMPPDGDIAS